MGKPSGQGRASQYDDFAVEYARHSAESVHNALYERPMVLQLLGDVDGLRVLDAGCGPGLTAEELVRRGARVTALDASQAMVDLTRERLGSAAVVEQHDLARPLERFPDASFDAVLLALVIHYLDDRHLVLRETHRLLSPGGRLVVSTHHPMTDWLRLGGSYFDSERVEEHWGPGWPVSFRRQPLDTTCTEFLEAGFVIERVVEPRPSTQIRDRDPEAYRRLAQQPAFIAFRLIKPAA